MLDAMASSIDASTSRSAIPALRLSYIVSSHKANMPGMQLGHANGMVAMVCQVNASMLDNAALNPTCDNHLGSEAMKWKKKKKPEAHALSTTSSLI